MVARFAQLTPWCFFVWLIGNISAQGVEVKFDQTFGANGYTGTRIPVTLLNTKLDETNPKWLQAGIGIDTYQDDSSIKRFFAFEPKLRVFGESEAGIMVNYRLVPRTDDYMSQSVGIEVRYSVYHDIRSEKGPQPIIEEVEIGGEVRRTAHSDNLNLGRTKDPDEFQTSETLVILTGRALHTQWGSGVPKVTFQLAKSFYSQNVDTARPAPMTSVLGATPFIQSYLNFVMHTEAEWILGRPTGFTIEPRVYYTFFSTASSQGTGYALGGALKAGTSGFGVQAGYEYLRLGSYDGRSYLTLGANVSF